MNLCLSCQKLTVTLRAVVNSGAPRWVSQDLGKGERDTRVAFMQPGHDKIGLCACSVTLRVLCMTGCYVTLDVKNG